MLIKLEWLGYRVVKKLWRYVKPFRYNTGTWRTDGRTDDQTENSYINIQLTRRAVKTGWLQKLPMPRPRNHVRFTSLASGHCLLSAVCYLIATVYLFDYLACQQLAVFIAKHVCSRTNCALPGQPIDHSSANNQSINSATNLQNYSRKLAELFFHEGACCSKSYDCDTIVLQIVKSARALCTAGGLQKSWPFRCLAPFTARCYA